jgi:hypothetical protein
MIGMIVAGTATAMLLTNPAPKSFPSQTPR